MAQMLMIIKAHNTHSSGTPFRGRFALSAACLRQWL